jgi:hypothetical protein
VQAVSAEVPAAARPAELTVRQRFVFVGLGGRKGPEQLFAAWQADNAAAGTPGAIGVGTQWGDGGAAAGLAARVAYRLVTGRTGEAQVEQGNELVGATACGGAGVLVVWLTGQAGTRARTGLRQLAGDGRDPGDGVSFQENELIPSVQVPAAELAVGLSALERPHADIAARIRQSWATLTAPGTTATQAAQLLGVPAPATEPACG